jgi:dipeptide/tripeptide permease
MFKPNISPILLDQMPLSVPVTKTLNTGEKVIVDPDATIERVVLWFYWLINVGGFMNVPTTILEKYKGWWLAFFLPLLLYLPLPFLLMWLKDKLILYPPNGSELGKVVRIVAFCFRHSGPYKLIRGDFFSAAKPSVIAASGQAVHVDWDDDFVEDVRRLFQACSIFAFFPIQYINDNGLGSAANISTTMFTTDGVPNDVISNFNSLVIILADPVLNYGLYPFLRRMRIEYGPVARMTTGLAISTIGGVAYAVVNHYGYKTSPCGDTGTSATCVDSENHALVSTLSVWWWAIPYSLGGLSELFLNVPAYGLAYSRAPKNMRGLVSGINLLSTAVAYAIGLILAPIVRDPLLTW